MFGAQLRSCDAWSGFEAEAMLKYLSREARLPTKQPLCPMRAIFSEVLVQMDRSLESFYSQTDRPSIASERLIRALLRQVPHSIRSERPLVERLETIRRSGRFSKAVFA